MKETKELGDETVFLFHLLIKNSEENIEVYLYFAGQNNWLLGI